MQTPPRSRHSVARTVSSRQKPNKGKIKAIKKQLAKTAPKVQKAKKAKQAAEKAAVNTAAKAKEASDAQEKAKEAVKQFEAKATAF